MTQDVPRRLMRFYRGKQNSSQQNNQQEYYPQNQESGFYDEENNENNNNYFGADKIIDKEQRSALNKIPSMDYEDLDKRNANEIRKFEQKNAENQLALSEIEKFKRENKRMPTKEETEKIAENLYTQLKENPIDYSGITQEDNTNPNQRLSPSQRRLQRISAKQGEPIPNPKNNTQNVGQNYKQFPPAPQTQQELNVKDLFSDEEPKKGSRDEFDLGLGEEEASSSNIASEGNGPESIEDIEEISMDEGLDTCPNCKKPTDKIIYCSKCGFAFCKSCTKKEGTENLCPKCSNKVKI